MDAVILAGGLGMRLRSVVADVPKPMAPVDGVPFLEHLLRYWRGQGVRRFVLSVGYRRQVVMEYFGEAFEGIPVGYAIEDSPMGTGGGVILGAREVWSETFLLLNGDTFFAVDLLELSTVHEAKDADLTVALVAVQQNTRYGSVDLDRDGRIRSLEGPEAAAGSAWVNGGVYIVEQSALADFQLTPGEKMSFEQEMLPRIIEGSGAVYGHVCQGRFLDIGVPEDYRRAGSFVGGGSA